MWVCLGTPLLVTFDLFKEQCLSMLYIYSLGQALLDDMNVDHLMTLDIYILTLDDPAGIMTIYKHVFLFSYRLILTVEYANIIWVFRKQILDFQLLISVKIRVRIVRECLLLNCWSVINYQLVQEAMLPGLRCLKLDMSQIAPEHEEVISSMIKEYESKIETSRPADRYVFSGEKNYNAPLKMVCSQIFIRSVSYCLNRFGICSLLWTQGVVGH